MDYGPLFDAVQASLRMRGQRQTWRCRDLAGLYRAVRSNVYCRSSSVLCRPNSMPEGHKQHPAQSNEFSRKMKENNAVQTRSAVEKGRCAQLLGVLVSRKQQRIRRTDAIAC